MHMSQFVEYLGLSRSFAGAPIEGKVEENDALVVLTIRPDPLINYRPHNIAITQDQAIRLLQDLHAALDPVLIANRWED